MIRQRRTRVFTPSALLLVALAGAATIVGCERSCETPTSATSVSTTLPPDAAASANPTPAEKLTKSAALDPAPILKRAADALAAVSSLSYAGTDAAAPDRPATVTATRAEAGGWKLAIRTGDATALAYDGVTARALRDADKALIEDTVLDEDALAAFAAKNSPAAPVAWELFAATPFADAPDATHAGMETVVGEPCDVISLLGPAGVTRRIAFAKSDGLPRRIERTTADAPRVITLADLRTNAAVAAVPFTLAAPDGYVIRSAEPRKPAPSITPRPRQAEAPPGGLAIGAPAPDFSLKDADGKDVTLASLKGQVVFLDFWATWCGPCRLAMPGVQKLHDEFKGRPVAVYGVNMNDDKDPIAYMRDKKFTYGTLLNGEKIAKAYGIQGIPAFYLIGPDGKLLWAGVGYGGKDADAQQHKQLVALIEKALAAK